jgi:hypothetical protein
LEGEFKWQPSTNWLMSGNAMYLADYKHTAKGDLENNSSSPHLMIKGGISYQSKDKSIVLGLYNSFFGLIPDIITTQQDLDPSSPLIRKAVNPVTEAFNLLSLNVRINGKKVLKIKDLPDFYFTVYGENLLAADIWMPELTYRRVNTMPYLGASRGRAFYAGIWLKF